MAETDLDPNRDPDDIDGEAAVHPDDVDATIPDTDPHLSKEFTARVIDAIRDEDQERARSLVSELHAADLADLLEGLSSANRISLVQLLGEKLDPEVLYEVDASVKADIVEHIPNEQIAEALTELDTDDAVYVLEELDEEDREEVLQALDADDRVAIEESLSYPAESAGRLMQRDLVALPEFWTVGQTIDYLRSETTEIPDDFYDIFVVDPAHHPVGTVPLSRVMRTHRPVTLGEVMDKDPYVIDAEADQEEVAYQFTKYHLISAAVIDKSQRLVGVVTVDDIVEVIEEEAEEDIMALAGVADASLNESILTITRQRFVWLLINMITAVASAYVISAFGATIQQMVALAALMPIVASLGGNAGNQTMTIAVRALATKELSTLNVWRVLSRELTTAVVNGAALAFIAGIVVWLVFHNPVLGGVMASALLINTIVAGMSGLLVPMGLSRAGIDPAVASTVLVTTITDVIGFLAFLGLAALVLL